MNYDQAQAIKFKCQTCQTRLEKFRRKKGLRYEVQYDCNNLDCFTSRPNVAYRKKLPKLRRRK